MKAIHRLAATLLLLAMLVSCAPSDADVSAEPTESPLSEPTTISDFDYKRYTNPRNAYYPEWAQPYSVYAYELERYTAWYSPCAKGEFTSGGYLTKEELEADPAKVASFLDYDNMTPAEPNTRVSYDENGHIMPDNIHYQSESEFPVEAGKPNGPPTDCGSANMTYEEYFVAPRFVEEWWNHPEDGAYEKLYELTPDIEELLSQYDIISPIHGSEITLFYMTSDYKIYRLHVPSGTVDFMCGTAFDFDMAQEWHREYRNYCDWIRRAWFVEDDEGYERREAITYEEWDEAKKALGDRWYWADDENDRLPDSGYFEVLSNNDVRFTVLAPEWMPYGNEAYNTWTSDWFSHIIYGTGSYFYGDYVTYSAALGKFGATERALDLLNIPQEQRMTFEEFCDYYGGYPPHSSF